MGQEREVLQQRKVVDEGYNRIHSETAQQRRKLGPWYNKIVDRRYMEGATITRFSIPKNRVQHAIYQRSHKQTVKATRGGRYAATWKAEDIIEDGNKIKDLNRVQPTTDFTSLRDELTYEKLIIFDWEKEVVQEEMQALKK